MATHNMAIAPPELLLRCSCLRYALLLLSIYFFHMWQCLPLQKNHQFQYDNLSWFGNNLSRRNLGQTL